MHAMDQVTHLSTPWTTQRRLLSKRVAGELRAARRRQGRSVESIAAEVGISAPFLWTLERSQRAPSLVVARDLIDVLRLPSTVAQALLDESAPNAGRSRR